MLSQRPGGPTGPEVRYTYRIALEYDGSDYAGWQRQPNVPTVEGMLLSACFGATGELPELTAAGRTDAGVHAHSQVVGCSIGRHWDPDAFQHALNAHLPADIAVVGVDLVDPAFHARFDALARTYRYLVVARPHRSPLARRYAWHITQDVDVSKMRSAGRLLEGTHDFASFGRSPRPAGSTVRTVHSVRIRVVPKCSSGGGAETTVVIEVTADAFLYGMMRALAGVLVSVGSGRLDVSYVRTLLSSPRSLPSRVTVAPAHGLHQWMVIYPDRLRSRSTVESFL